MSSIDLSEIYDFEYDKKLKKKIRWDISEMTKTKFRQRIERNPSFTKVFDEKYNLTKSFLKELKYRTTGEKNIILEVTGQTGIGKSKVSLSLAVNVMNKEISIEDVCFTTDDLLKRASQIGKNHTLIQDEQINQLGVGSVREQFERQTLEDTTRKFGLNIIFNSPTTKDHTTAHYNLEVVCICRKLRLSKVAIIGDNGQYLGYFVIKVLSNKNPLWKEYELKKDGFIKNILNRDNARLSLDDMSSAVMNHKLYSKATTRSLKKIVAVKMYPSLTTQEIEMVVDNIRLLEFVD